MVTQQTREIGIRIALGAAPAQVRRRILYRAARWAIIGLAIGLAASTLSVQLIASQLFQVPPQDPISLTAAALILILVTLVAAWLPSLRASRVDPAIALRAE